jgi:hypothetical protein
MEFLVESLTKNRDAAYKDIAEAAAKKKLKLHPIMYGRAQTLLGIVKMAPRGQGKMAKAKAKAAAAAGQPKRGPGRPRKAATATFDGSLDSIVAVVKSSERAKASYRDALQRIQSILAGVLA